MVVVILWRPWHSLLVSKSENYQMDLILRNGTLVDGTGGEPFPADIAIRDGRIADVGTVEASENTSTLDVEGLVVTPGFIDVHSHSDFTLVVDPRAVSSVTQGVTLEIVGNCGHGCAPISDAELARTNIYGCSTEHDIGWRTMAEYLDRIEEGSPAVNVVSLVPNGNLRLAVAGMVDRPSTTDELKEMKKLLAQSLEEGAFGFSTGLEYGPERACSEEEVIELCRVAAEAGGFYATHTRNRSGEARETIEEAIRAGRSADIPLQISHISVVARLAESGRWAVEQAIDQVDRARKEGLDVAFDMHTRLFGTTHLSAALPPWALEGDKAEIAARLKSSEERERMKDYQSIITALARDDWSRIVIFESKALPELSRKSITEVSESTGRDPLDAIYDALLSEIDDLHSLMVIAYAYNQEDNRIAFEHPCCMVGSDATALATDGPLCHQSFHGAFTWASWYFRHFVRDTKTLTLEEAVRRLTSLPAERAGLTDRGVIRPGACADLAVFDPAVFEERGTTFEPNQTATGMTHVIVNGVVTLEDGVMTGERGGQVLRKV
jgi:N-acyl-D-aspartate/D-glutamate deacylase